MTRTAEMIAFPQPAEPDTWSDPRFVADDSDPLAPARGLLVGILCGSLFWAGILTIVVIF